MNIIKRFVNWVENGDLIPAIIAVSVPHYASVLARYDFWPVASIIGFLVDIGHYRTIKIALRGKGWGWMIVLTAFSVSFHVAFYELGGAGWSSLFLGAAPPAVIFALAYITRAEKLDSKIVREHQKEHDVPVLEQVNPVSEHEIPVSEHESKVEHVRLARFSDYVSLNESRNGDGPVSAKSLIMDYKVNPSTAYTWYRRYAGMDRNTKSE